MNQCSFRHSWRSRPLKLSTMALSVGLPGLLQVDLDATLVGPLVHHFADELAAVVCFDRLGLSTLMHDGAQDAHHVFAVEALTDMNGQALARAAIHYREHAQLASIEQVIGHQVHAPDVIDPPRQCFGLAQLCGLVSFGPLVAQRQAVLLVRAVEKRSPVGFCERMRSNHRKNFGMRSLQKLAARRNASGFWSS